MLVGELQTEQTAYYIAVVRRIRWIVYTFITCSPTIIHGHIEYNILGHASVQHNRPSSHSSNKLGS